MALVTSQGGTSAAAAAAAAWAEEEAEEEEAEEEEVARGGGVSTWRAWAAAGWYSPSSGSGLLKMSNVVVR